jgi:MurNAc alpha-1-phosphate uridylyltransferase
VTQPRAAIVLAAGLGTRMRPLTDACPKALLPVAGRALVDRAIDHARAAGLSPIVVNVHYRAEQMRAHLAGSDVLISDETDMLLETGGGVRRALPRLGSDPFVVLNSDAIWAGPSPLPALLAAWDPSRMDGLLQVVPRAAARAHGGAGDVFVDTDGRLRFRDGAASAPYVYTGAQILRPSVFDDTPDGAFPMMPVWRALVARGRLFAVVHPGPWVDVGTPAGLSAAEALLADG